MQKLSLGLNIIRCFSLPALCLCVTVGGADKSLWLSRVAFSPPAQSSSLVFNRKMVIAGLGVCVFGVLFHHWSLPHCSPHGFCPSEEEWEPGWRCHPTTTWSHNYTRTRRLRRKGWKIYSSIDAATHSFLNNGLQSHFITQKIAFSPLWQLCGRVGVSRWMCPEKCLVFWAFEFLWMLLFNPVSAHLTVELCCLYWGKKGNWLSSKCLNEMWLICLYSPSLLSIPTHFRFHSAWWKVPTLNQTFNLEVHVSLFPFPPSGFTIIAHTCSISTCAFNSPVYIKGLTN